MIQRHKLEKPCDIAVIGAGPAGVMAAISALELKKEVILIERNSAVCRKLLLTGGGRCNITSASGLEGFLEAFGKAGRFLRTAFSLFSNDDLTEFFRRRGLDFKEEENGRIFPVTDSASSVADILREILLRSAASVLFDTRITGIEKRGGSFRIATDSLLRRPTSPRFQRDASAGGTIILAHRVVLATGVASYESTGSTGDGFNFAAGFGHSITSPMPALVPLVTKEKWVSSLQGVSLKRARIVYRHPVKKTTSAAGEILFTHFGLSGPLILDLSADIVSYLADAPELPIAIDLMPDHKAEQVEKRLLRAFSGGHVQLNNALRGFLPERLIYVILSVAGIPLKKNTNQVSRQERQKLTGLLKALPLTVTGSLKMDKAMVTRGGVSIKEIDPRTMASKMVPGLYFAGEMIDVNGASGGYNLQEAFSTGYLAGREAAKCAEK